MITEQPNILFILSDQQRWDTVSCYGRPIFPHLTPHLDRLASEGVRFQHAFTAQPVCGPCRASLQTGLYPTQIGCHVNNRPLPLDQRTIAHEVADAGYETAYVGKWHLASDEERLYHTAAVPPERRGGYRDYWVASDVLEFTSHGYEGYFFDKDNQRLDWEGYRVDRTTDFALHYLRQYARRQPRRPFFLFLSYIEPHHQNDLDRYIGPIGSKQRFADFSPPGDLSGAGGDWQRQMPDYLGACWSIDQNVGRLRDELTKLGIAESTLLVYTSDHGCHFRTRNREYKRSAHDSSLRVPLIVHGPGFTGGQVRDELVSLLDLPPTIAAAAGARPPQAMRGRPLQDLVHHGVTDWNEEIYAQISESQVGRALRTRRWKYGITDPTVNGWTVQPSAARYVEQYLYDLDADPHERRNLVDDPAFADIRAHLARRMKACMAHAGEEEAVIDPAP